MTTWATDTDVNNACLLARSALVAINDAGSTSYTTYDIWRTEAKRQITARLRQKGIFSTEIDRSSDLVPVEVALTLALMFEACQQWNREGSKDVYAHNAEFWRRRYEEELLVCAPIDGVRSAGASFEIGRG